MTARPRFTGAGCWFGRTSSHACHAGGGCGSRVSKASPKRERGGTRPRRRFGLVGARAVASPGWRTKSGGAHCFGSDAAETVQARRAAAARPRSCWPGVPRRLVCASGTHEGHCQRRALWHSDLQISWKDRGGIDGHSGGHLKAGCDTLIPVSGQDDLPLAEVHRRSRHHLKFRNLRHSGAKGCETDRNAAQAARQHAQA